MMLTSSPDDTPQKYVLKCRISRVVKGVQTYLFLVIGDKGRYCGYLDLPGGKTNKFLRNAIPRSDNGNIITLGSLQDQKPSPRSYLLVREDFIDCLEREVFEETGIPIYPNKITHSSTHNLPIKDGKELLIIGAYEYDLGEDELVEIQLSSEHVASYWLTKKEIEKFKDRIVPSLRVVLGLTRPDDFVDESPLRLETLSL